MILWKSHLKLGASYLGKGAWFVWQGVTVRKRVLNVKVCTWKNNPCGHQTWWSKSTCFKSTSWNPGEKRQAHNLSLPGWIVHMVLGTVHAITLLAQLALFGLWMGEHPRIWSATYLCKLLVSCPLSLCLTLRSSFAGGRSSQLGNKSTCWHHWEDALFGKDSHYNEKEWQSWLRICYNR